MKPSLLERIENMSKDTTLREVQDYVKQMVIERGFEKETLQDTMLLLTEEMGELAKEVRKQSKHLKVDVTNTKPCNIEDEIADVFNYLLAMCNILEVDLLECFKVKERKNCNRTWK